MVEIRFFAKPYRISKKNEKYAIYIPKAVMPNIDPGKQYLVTLTDPKKLQKPFVDRLLEELYEKHDEIPIVDKPVCIGLFSSATARGGAEWVDKYQLNIDEKKREKLLEVLGEIFGIDDVFKAIIIVGEDDRGNPYVCIF